MALSTSAPALSAALASAPFPTLTPADLAFLGACATERTLDEGASLEPRRGEEAACVLVLSGELRSRGADWQRHYPAGQVIGVRAFLERTQQHQTQQCVATQQTRVWIVPHRELRARCATAPAFAARLLETCTRALLGREGEQPSEDCELVRLQAVLEELQLRLHDAEVAALQSDGQPPEEHAALVRVAFRHMVEQLHRTLGEASGRSEAEREAWGRTVQRAVLPYLLLTETSERLYAKPRGYAGDSVSIEGIYAYQPSGFGRLGPLLDQCFLDEPAAQAVRNRRGLLAEEIRAVLARVEGRPVEITTMACGPAREVFDVFAELDDPQRLKVHLIDFDAEALEEVARRAEAQGLSAQMELHHANLIDLSIGRQKLDLPPQDLVYSIGLIDYFVDKLVVKLMSYGQRLLRPGAEMILGNFHPRNENKPLMDYVLDWRLIHRTEDDLSRLYQESAFARSATRFRFEGTGVNLFAVCRKAREDPDGEDRC